MKRSSAMSRRAAMALNSLVADCGPQPSRSSSFFVERASRTASVKMSSGDWIRPSS